MKNSSKNKLPIIIALAATVIVIILIIVVGSVMSQKSYDTVKDNDNSSSSSAVQSSSSKSADDSYAAIKVTNGFKDENFDPVFYAKRLYELKYQFGTDKFSSVKDMSVSAAVQFAFCHIYYDSLVDMPDEKTMLFRQVLPESVSEKINALFGENNIDVTKSDLYNKDNGLLEMWQPALGTPVYANVTCEKLDGNKFKVTAIFFKETEKNKKDSSVTGVFEKQGDEYVILSMESE